MSRSLRRDEQGVTEVLGYLLGFLASFVLLMLTLFGFAVVSNQATETGARTELRDVAQRAASLVHKAMEAGTLRTAAAGDIDASKTTLVFTIDVPPSIRTLTYTLAVSNTQVTATSSGPGYREVATTLHFIIPSCADGPDAGSDTNAETAAAAVCSVGGSTSPSASTVRVVYEYDTSTSPYTNRIVLS